ncbi:PIN domain-containing protein [Thermococcus sp. JCM 11816]|uniref:type II toxin-antitoxin system VapC family toxin n=1 Tax=Thermococcus sp. (strain JCM 11816 / KS-1) TaxID=1295125 RepID=UPI0006D19F79
MIVVDTSLFVDYLFEGNEERYQKASKILESIEGLTVFEPKVFLVEMMAVSKRLGINISTSDLEELTADFTFISEDAILREALDVAASVHPRAIDSYFIATAKVTNSVLLSSDRRMCINAKKYGVEAYYVLEELEEALKVVEAV